jgi:arginine/lysine/ornithine decarboxylase
VKTTAFKKLKKLLTKLFVKYPESTKKAIQRNPAPFVLGEEVEKEWVKIEDSVGRVCAGACGLFPPCTPLIFAGEVITKEKIELLQTANHCFGVIDQKISVVKEQK